ncbi:MAG: cation-translocating P-type ATPase [Actinomycetota bacterium]
MDQRTHDQVDGSSRIGNSQTVEESGLSSVEAARLLSVTGPNRLVPEARHPSAFGWIARAVMEPMSLLLLVAAGTYLLLRDWLDAIVAFAALIPIVLVTVVLEARSESALQQLEVLTAPTATVRRDGAERSIPAAEVVPDDLLLLREGDVVPADASIVNAGSVTVDESALTGESLPVTKQSDGEGEDALVFAGTTVRSGRASARVSQTGAQTRYGRIGTLLAQVEQPPTPLQRIIHRLVWQLGAVAAGFCVAVVVVQLVRGGGWGAAIIAGVSLGIAAVPEEFPMVFTLYLSLGAWRLAKDRALVRRLVGVETLGSTTIICTDKTGTLTLGRLDVKAAASREGAITDAVPPGMLEIAVLASEPDPFDPLDQAIVRLARDSGIDVDALHSRALVRDYEFDPHSKTMAHVWSVDGALHIAAKGALEGILERSACDTSERDAAHEANRILAARGMRVIALADGSLASSEGDRAQDERALGFAGLVAFSDPARPGIAEALAECASAGIRVIMITGDHPATAVAIAEGIGLQSGDGVVTGDELDRASDDEIVDLVAHTTIFARTRPEQKHRIVRALAARGEVVAMTGDGVNDAPALREAHIGVAMGERGTAVAREAATMVLLDDNFATIVKAVRDGRRIFDNLRRAFGYLIAFHVPLLLAALVIPLLGKPFLLLPIHIVLLELLLHPIVSLVFENDPAEPDVMRRPPRPPRASFLSRGEMLRSAGQGFGLSIGIVVLYLWRLGAGTGRARALGLVTLLLGEACLILTSRARDVPVWRAPMRGNRVLVPLVATMLGVAVAIVYIPPLAHALRIKVLIPVDWAIAAVVAIASTIWTEPFKRS